MNYCHYFPDENIRPHLSKQTKQLLRKIILQICTTETSTPCWNALNQNNAREGRGIQNRSLSAAVHFALTRSFSTASNISKQQLLFQTGNSVLGCHRVIVSHCLYLYPSIAQRVRSKGFWASSPSSVSPSRLALHCTPTSSLTDRLTDVAKCTLFKHLLYYCWVTGLEVSRVFLIFHSGIQMVWLESWTAQRILTDVPYSLRRPPGVVGIPHRRFQ